MAEPVALDVRDLRVTRGRRTTLQSVSLQAHFGEVLAVLGPNGAGKSTLLSALAGLVPYAGSIALAGEPLHALAPRMRAQRLSFVPQHSRLQAAMRVADVVRQGRFAHRRSLGRFNAEDHREVAEAIAETDVEALADRPFNELSFGEQKRVLIARALATGARTLLLDEPTASLDIAHGLRLFLLLRRLASQGRAVLVVLHQLDDARTYADRIALLDAGKLLAFGPSREVLTAERVRAVYNVEMCEGAALGYRLPEGGG